jgi:hypothetical protein
MNTFVSKRLGSKEVIRAKMLTMVLGIAAAVALPQVFHLIGILSGTGAVAGTIFLPMHIPVFIVGLLAGPAVGLVAGAISPIISFAISGMPTAAMLPFMIVELAGYGLTAGLFVNKKMPMISKLFLAQIGGRVLRAIFTLFAIYALSNQTVKVIQVWNAVKTGLPGILLQLTIIPLLLHRIEGVRKHYE